mgnify:CR=1 FL=1
MIERRRPHLPPPPSWEDEPVAEEHNEGWLIIYLDVMTLMLSLFVLLLAYSSYSTETYKALTKTLSNPVAVQGPVEAPVEPELQREQHEAALDRPAEVEAEQLQERFRSALRSQRLAESIEVSVAENQVNLQISDAILFRVGEAELTTEGEAALVKLVPLLDNASDHTLSIEGHTDPTPISNPRFPSNWELSAQRATGVLRFLLSQGVDGSRMRAVGYADTRPRDDNNSAEGRARNRRVALVLHLGDE